MFTFRLPREEMALIEQAATEAGMSVAEFVRKSVAMRPTISVLARPQYDLLVGTPFFTVWDGSCMERIPNRSK